MEEKTTQNFFYEVIKNYLNAKKQVVNQATEQMGEFMSLWFKEHPNVKSVYFEGNWESDDEGGLDFYLNPSLEGSFKEIEKTYYWDKSRTYTETEDESLREELKELLSDIVELDVDILYDKDFVNPNYVEPEENGDE